MKCTTPIATALALLATLALGGCGEKSGYNPKRDSTVVKKAHDHPDEGPHHGALAEWGDEDYHAEFTVDHQKQEVRVYILGPDARKSAPIKADKILLTIKTPSFQLELKPEAQKDDPAGTASCFVGKHERFAKEQEFAGTISGEVEGKPFAGDFKEKPEGAGHKH